MKKIISATCVCSILLLHHAEAKKIKNETPIPATWNDTISYAFGLDIGNSLSDFKGEISIEQLIKGLRDNFTGKEILFTPEQVKTLMQKHSAQMREKKFAQFKITGEKNLLEGKKFLDENSKKEGVIVTESGLQYSVLTEGNGLKARPGSEVRIQFRGTFIDGTEFDNTSKSGGPIELVVSNTIKGMAEALQLMKTGSKYKVVIPPQLAYNDIGRIPDIPPYTVLIYEIELLEVVE